MLKVHIRNSAGAVIAEGTCSDSGFFPPALASIYNTGLNLVPPRSLERFDDSLSEGTSDSADYPVGTRRATFGYAQPSQDGRGRVFDDEVIVHVERT